MITELTPEQEAQIPIYREKWRQIALSTQRIDRAQAANAILTAYNIAGAKSPKIIFCDSPYAAFVYINQEKPSWEKPTELLGYDLASRLRTFLQVELTNQLTEEFFQELWRKNKPIEKLLVFNLPMMTVGLWEALGQKLELEIEGWDYNKPSVMDLMQWASHEGSFQTTVFQF